MRGDVDSVYEDAFNLLCGTLLGSGMSRKVFECKFWKGHVVKVEQASDRFQNVMEWQVWSRVCETAHAKWFAPCKMLSPNGQILIMEQTFPAPPDAYDDRMPAFFTDMKRQNFGTINGRLVCHDYATTLLMEVGMTKRLKKAEWWNE